MKKTRPPVPLSTLLPISARTAISAGILALIVATACTYTSPSDLCSRFESAPLKEPTGDPPLLVILDPAQRFAVFHGSACAKSDEDGTENIIKVQESLELPAFANRATVILNGWKVKYLHKDHHVQGVGTLIGKISLERNTLNWQAAGILSDKNFDDAYEWCYHYTVVAWNDPAIDAVVDQDDATAFCRSDGGTADNFFFAPNNGTTTALASFSSFLQNPAFVSRGTVAVLPRGFGFDGGTDHHLLQIAYDLDHGETFVEQQKPYWKGSQEVTIPSTLLTSHADSGFVSWNTRAIFKDNDKRRGYHFGEMVSALGGRDVGVIQPPYTILPIEDPGWTTTCVRTGQPEVVTQEFTVENIPFECAVPMLTGWELAYMCGDQHVTEMGTWIEDWNYVLGPQGGTLRYTVSSVLRDKDSDPENTHSRKVTILGIGPIGDAKNRVAGPGGPDQGPGQSSGRPDRADADGGN